MCVGVSRQTQHNKFIIDDGIIGGNTTTGPVCLSAEVFERLGGELSRDYYGQNWFSVKEEKKTGPLLRH